MAGGELRAYLSWSMPKRKRPGGRAYARWRIGANPPKELGLVRTPSAALAHLERHLDKRFLCSYINSVIN